MIGAAAFNTGSWYKFEKSEETLFYVSETANGRKLGVVRYIRCAIVGEGLAYPMAENQMTDIGFIR